jgi:hydrogenase maturation protease
VIGLGNPVLSDDGVGIRVVRSLALDARCHGVDIVEASVGGLRLLDLIVGYDAVVLVDAIVTRNGRPGPVDRLPASNALTTLHSGCSHDLSLAGALRLGRSLHIKLPCDDAIRAVAVEAADVRTFGESCTSHVISAIPMAVEAVLQELALIHVRAPANPQS